MALPVEIDRSVFPLTRFTYKSWGGSRVTVEAGSVSFEPSGHVVFRDHHGRVVWADQSNNVNGLQEQGANGNPPLGSAYEWPEDR